MRPSRLLTPLLAAAAAFLAVPIAAEAACTISTTAVNFGTYNVFASTADDGTGQITFRCTSPRPPLITIQLDKGGSPTFNPRQMHKGSETLNYNLYLDSTRTTIWGDGTGGSQTFTRSSPPVFQNVNVTVYGRIPASQDVSAGAYSATVTATISF
ncbi:MAG TPA: spore coat U domain-containing protein [Methylomirabilota bacterium]|nr:spore coat U domain-containing protein [Methylomirabilota bacterium]